MGLRQRDLDSLKDPSGMEVSLSVEKGDSVELRIDRPDDVALDSEARCPSELARTLATLTYPAHERTVRGIDADFGDGCLHHIEVSVAIDVHGGDPGEPKIRVGTVSDALLFLEDEEGQSVDRGIAHRIREGAPGEFRKGECEYANKGPPGSVTHHPPSPSRNCFRPRESPLPREIYRPGFADEHDLDLPRVLELLLEAPRDLLGDLGHLFVGDLVRLDHDPHLAPCLNREAPLHPGEVEGDLLELLEPLSARK
jgi:hypothetical protein